MKIIFIYNVAKARYMMLAISAIIVASCIFFYILINSTPDLKIKLFKFAAFHYHNTIKYKLASRFTDTQLQEAIEHAKQQPWVQQQIAADLAPFKNGISEQQVAAWFTALRGELQYNELVKFKISSGTVSVYPSEVKSYTLAYETIVEVVQILVQQQLIPDCEFLIALSDYVYHVPAEIQEPVPVFSFAKHLQIPIEKDAILVPDWINIRGSDELRSRIKLANKLYPWHTKKDILHWRGGVADSMLHRSKLVALANKLSFLDVGMTGVVPELAPEFSLQNKYQIALDGARCTWSRMVWQMYANSLMIKPESPQVQWYFRGLEPYVNYLPIADIDERNINAVYTWLKENDSKAQEITHNANVFASKNFKTQDYIAYYALLLQEYAKLMATPSFIQREHNSES